jgi:hypothetical protein
MDCRLIQPNCLFRVAQHELYAVCHSVVRGIAKCMPETREEIMSVHFVVNTYAVRQFACCGIVGDFGIEREGTKRYESKPIRICIKTDCAQTGNPRDGENRSACQRCRLILG